jgi:hypothetical protein
VSRHRSPSGRLAHQRQLPSAGAPPRPTPPPDGPARRRAGHAAARRSALRTGLSAAATAGGALSLVSPAVALVGEAPAVADTAPTATVLRLSADAAGAHTGLPGPAGVRLVSSFGTVAPEPQPTVDATGLLKAAGLADLARRAEEERLAREARARCDADLGGLGGVKPWVRDGARFLSCLYDRPTLIGVASRSGSYSDHPSGHAVDFMTRGERGDRIAECALANQEELGVEYVIWEQRINYGDGWEYMADRGGDTANHYDHVHVSFERRAPDGEPTAEACG